MHVSLLRAFLADARISYNTQPPPSSYTTAARNDVLYSTREYYDNTTGDSYYFYYPIPQTRINMTESTS